VTSLQAPASAAGERVDRYLARELGQSRSRIQRLLRGGLVTAGGSTLKPSHLLRGGETIRYELPPPPPDLPLPEEGPLAILHEDRGLLVVDKQAGLIVHPGSGISGGTLVNRLLHHRPDIAGVGSAQRPGIVHRLDRGTSGVLAVACSEDSYRRLSEAFANRSVRKTYLAVVHGRPRLREGRIDEPIGRHPTVRTRMAVVPLSRGGRSATSLYRLLASTSGLSLLEIRILTGRTHQIRVHCKAIGHPIVGDPTYGEPRWRTLPPALRRPVREFGRPALHAHRLTLPTSDDGATLSFTAPVPQDLHDLCTACGLDHCLPADPEATAATSRPT